jgi:ribosomal protein S20
MTNSEFEPNYQQMLQVADGLQKPFIHILKQGRIMPPEALGGLALHLIINARIAKLPTHLVHKLIDILDVKVQVLTPEGGNDLDIMLPPEARAAAKRVEAAVASGDVEDMQKALQALADLMGSAAVLRKQEMDKVDAKVREATERVIAKVAETITPITDDGKGES